METQNPRTRVDETRSCDTRTDVAGTSGAVTAGTSETWGTWQGALGPSWHYSKLGDQGAPDSTLWDNRKWTSVATITGTSGTRADKFWYLNSHRTSQAAMTGTSGTRQPWWEPLGQPWQDPLGLDRHVRELGALGMRRPWGSLGLLQDSWQEALTGIFGVPVKEIAGTTMTGITGTGAVETGTSGTRQPWQEAPKTGAEALPGTSGTPWQEPLGSSGTRASKTESSGVYMIGTSGTAHTWKEAAMTEMDVR